MNDDLIARLRDAILNYEMGTSLATLVDDAADALEAQAKRIEELQAAMTRWMEAVDKWLASGKAASPDESRSIYEQARAALEKPNV
jgi:coproporphyrinogen III oxidase-like Fe-S oxidoreductase